jgi:hypothetical protein
VSAHCLDLTGFVHAVGATFDAERPAGAFNCWGNSYPAEELPFGRRTAVGGVPYTMVGKTPRRPDHLEALGQLLPGGPAGRPIAALGLLAAGEMGHQRLTVRVHRGAAAGAAETYSATIRGWILDSAAPVGDDVLRCSHLHYPGGYGLPHRVPALWSHMVPLAGGGPVTALELCDNPLVHIFAVTLLMEAGS